MRKGEKEKASFKKARLAVKRRSPRLLVSASPFLFLLLAILFLASSVSAATTLAEYRREIQKTKNLVDVLVKAEAGDSSTAESAKSLQETLAKLRASLPVSEKIEWQGTSIETNNQWLPDKLNEYEKDESKHLIVLSEIGERLSSIEQKLDELEKAAASNRSKDEDKQKLGEILRREEYQKPKVEEKSLIRGFLEAIAKWFASEAPDPKLPSSPAGLESLSLAMQILLYVVILGAIGFLLYRFVPFFANRFNRREKREKKERVILGERIAADESADNIFSEAERLAREGNMRGAIRKGYIALLCELSDRKIIGLSRHKTNRDYLRDVRKRGELYENMNGLTSNFELHWYGAVEADEKDWEEFRNGYRRAMSAKN